MAVTSIDHVAVPIQRVEAMRKFYELFGFTWDNTNAPHLYAVQLGGQKLNFHDPSLWQNARFTLRASKASPGCADLCFVWTGDSQVLVELLQANEVPIEVGPVQREGGAGQGTSVYVRDPDNNLIEFINYDP